MLAYLSLVGILVSVSLVPNTVSANESLVSAIVSEASVSDALLTNERCH